MSWMIRSLSELKGTCYIELLPGRFTQQCWNPQSMFFEEEHFGFIEPTILRHCPKHDHYSFTDIDKATWEKILTDLEKLHDAIVDGAKLGDLKSNVDLFFTTTEHQFCQRESENLKHLQAMLGAFIQWTSTTLKQHDTIAVLGM